MRIILTVVLICFFGLSACTQGYRTVSTDPAKNKRYFVKLKPKPAQDELEVKSPPQGYNKDGKKDGYVGFGEGEYGSITFYLQGEEMGAQCADGADWVITEVALSDEGDSEEKGTRFNMEQDDWLVEAFPGTVQSTGINYSATKDTGHTLVSVVDENDHPAAWGPKTAYYRITVTECDDESEVLVSDPGVGNRGK